MQDHTFGQSEYDQRSQDILDNLHALTRDLESFVSGWSQRVDRAIESSRPVPLDDQGLQKRAKQLQLEKRQWESERAAEQLVAKGRIEQLTDAWLQLESEQRAFLQIKATQHGTRNTATDGNDSSMNRSNTNSMPIALSKSIAPLNTLSSGSPSRDRDDAAQQFKRLRREIDSSRSESGQQ